MQERPAPVLTGLIFAGVAVATTGVYAGVTMAPVVARDVTGSAFLSGLPNAALLSGAALGAAGIGAVARRRDRRTGLLISYLIGASAFAVVALATAAAAFPLLLLGMMGVGVGHAANQLARYAAADLHPAVRRPTVIGWIVWAQAVGAVVGPLSLGLARPLGTMLGAPAEAGAFVLGVVLLAGAVVLYFLVRSPLPSLDPPAETRGLEEAVSPWGRPSVRVAAVSMVTGQVVMLLIMTMTPVHVRDAGHGLAVLGGVMSAHTFGMFGLAPLPGWMSARIGGLRVILAGMALLGAAAVMGAAVHPGSGLLLSVALFVLGLGWSFSFVAGSSLLTRDLSAAERTRVQARVEALVWTSAAVASVCSGVLLGAIGFSALCLIGGALLVFPLAVIAVHRRRIEPAVA